MNRTFKNENGHLIADVSFGSEEIKKATEKGVRKLCEGVTVPGFRKGKAPLEEARKRLRSNDVAQATIDELLHQVDNGFMKDDEFSSYVKDSKILGSFRPSVSVNKFSDTEVAFTIRYILRPSCAKLGDYKGLKSNIAEKKVEDKDVEEFIDKLAKDNAELIPTEEPAKMGDTANIDFVGLMDGKEFEGGSAKGFDLVLGSKHFVPGFEEQVVSHKAGEKFDISLTMPDNYPEPLTSKPVIFKVTLNSVKVSQVPEINDEFATTLSGEFASKDLAELKEKVSKHLTDANHKRYLTSLVNDLLNQVRDSSEFVISDEYIDSLVKQRREADEKQINSQGLTLEEYLKLINRTDEEYMKQLHDGVLSELKTTLTYDGIASAEKIPSPAQADLEKRLGSPVNSFINNLTSYLRNQKMSEQQIHNQINNYLNQVFISILNERVQTRVLELNGYKVSQPADEKPSENNKGVEAKETKEEKATDEKSDATAK